LITFHSETEDLPQRLAAVIIENWFADMKSGNTKYIIFKDKVLNYEIGNALEIEEVSKYMRSMGTPESQITGSISWGV
jgi:thymidine phosphorylase